MPKTDQTTNPFDPTGQWQTLRDQGMDAWSKTMLDFVHSDNYAKASAEWLDTYLTASEKFQDAVNDAVVETLGRCNIPTSDDIERLAQRLLNVELKLDDLDARLDEILVLLKGISKTLADKPEPV